MKKIILVALLMTFTSITIFSQSMFSIHVGPSLPNGDFADDDPDTFLDGDTGGAVVGFNFGARLRNEINSDGLGWFVGVDLTYNAISDDIQDEYEDAWSNFDSFDVTFSKIINVPVSVGIDYVAPSSSNAAFYANGGLVLNFLNLTNLEASGDGDNFSASENYEFDLSTKIGLKLGGGVLLNDKYKVELNYFGIGEHNLEGDYIYEDSFSEGDRDNIDIDKNVSFFTLTFGIIL